ncbi:hypothetical protein HEP73_00071 [Xanthomonas sp. GW]|uniref:hypothetical protein n=1 Tax=Xanthomonas sp. GW TaxID=2724121 RepID=UPI00163A20F6|nr:hypothetical protein [Xanthomonas sp. GW]QNH19185.1 hypothetical protein HEP73_00071 [Xanthomonas sp. GW]
MPRKRALAEAEAGKLISSIQKEWGKDTGTAQAKISEHVMESAHTLLQAAHGDRLEEALGGRSVVDYLGALWVKRHPSVLPAIYALEAARFKRS